MTLFLQSRQLLPYLDLSRAEDTMELSSDIERPSEAVEVDLDLDLTGDDQPRTEDQMMEEVANEITYGGIPEDQDMLPGDDEEMADDGSTRALVEDNSSIIDDSLEDADYSQPDIGDDTIIATENTDTMHQPPRLPEEGDEVELGAEEMIGNQGQDEVEDSYAFDSHQDHPQHRQASEHHDQSSNQVQKPVNVDKVNCNIEPTEITAPERSSEVEDSDQAGQEIGETSFPEDDNEDEEAALNGPDQDRSELTDQDPAVHLNDAPGNAHEALDGPSKHEILGTSTSEAQPTRHPAGEQSPEQAAPDISESLPDPNAAGTAIGDAGDMYEKDAALQRTSEYIHPVSIVYQESDISLFPLEQTEGQESTYFLEDTKIASKSIKHLLDALRSVLGENVGEKDELCMEIIDMGLQISEVSLPH